MSGTNGNGNGNFPAPKTNGNGRTAKGTFAVGNPGGPGNPWAKMSQRLQAALTKAGRANADGERRRIDALAEELWTMALGVPDPEDKTALAKRWAMEQLLNRFLGKPKEHIDLDANLNVTVVDFFRKASERARARVIDQ